MAIQILRSNVLILTLMLVFYSCQRPEKVDTDEFKFKEMGVAEIQKGYTESIFTVREVVQAYLERIEAIDKNGPSLNSVLTINPDALAIADSLDVLLKKGDAKGALFGIPILLKDNIDTHDKMPCTAGSRALADSYPQQDSHLVKLLRASGAIILGKTNLSEWANFRGEESTSGWSGLGGQTHNPYDLRCNPCGSSSGSAVSVSANLAVLAIGTETNGSIVCPSQTNGIVGIKPTVGLISRSGIIPISFTQDTPGPMTRTVRDAAICLGVLAGIDSTDSKTINPNRKAYSDYTQFLKTDALKGKRLGFFSKPKGIHSKVDQLMEENISWLKSQGVEVIEVKEIMMDDVNMHSFNILLYEFKDGLNNYFKSLKNVPIQNVHDLIEFNKKDPIELKYFGQEYLIMASKMNDLNDREYKSILAKALKGSRENGIDYVMDSLHLDAIIAPTGSPAWRTDLKHGDRFILESSSPAAISGYPNITVPMGFIDALPVGISFFGRAWSEAELIAIAYSYEQGTQLRKSPKFLHSKN